MPNILPLVWHSTAVMSFLSIALHFTQFPKKLCHQHLTLAPQCGMDSASGINILGISRYFIQFPEQHFTQLIPNTNPIVEEDFRKPFI